MNKERPKCFSLLCCMSKTKQKPLGYAVYYWEDCPIKKECFEAAKKKWEK